MNKKIIYYRSNIICKHARQELLTHNQINMHSLLLFPVAIKPSSNIFIFIFYPVVALLMKIEA